MQTTTLGPFIDYTLLKPDATLGQLETLCITAREHAFANVCVSQYMVPYAAGLLGDSTVGVCTVVGFPHGNQLATSKLTACENALDVGATELDVVWNRQAFHSGDTQTLAAELRLLSEFSIAQGIVLKIIIESGSLSISELETAARLCADADVPFVKTSTGFHNVGAEIEKVRLLRTWLPPHIRIKAAGGIRTVLEAFSFLEAGAGRIGASSLLV